MGIRGLAYSFFARGFTTLQAAITLLATAWYFGAAGRGTLAATTSLVAIISTIIGCSIGRNLARHIQVSEIGGKRFIGENLRGIFRSVGLIIIATWIALGICGAVARSWLGELRWYHLAAGALWAPYYVWAQFSETVYAGLNQVKYFNSWQIGTAMATMGFAILGGWLLPGQLLTFMVITGALLLCCTGIEMWWVYSRFVLPQPGHYQFGSSLTSAGYLHLDTVGALFFANAGTMFVNKADGFSGAGAFEMAAKLSAMWGLIALAVRTNLLAHTAQVGVKLAWENGRRLILACIALSAVFALVGARFFGHMVEKYFHGFDGWTVYFLIFSSIAILSSLPTILSPLFIAKGWSKYMGVCTFILGCLNLSLMCWLVPAHGIVGALIALWTSYLVAFLINIGMTHYLASAAPRATST